MHFCIACLCAAGASQVMPSFPLKKGSIIDAAFSQGGSSFAEAVDALRTLLIAYACMRPDERSCNEL